MVEELGLAQRFARSFERFEIGGRPLCVAISGGSDSVALLCLLKETAPSFQIKAVHIDHCLRPESPAEAEFVGGLCARLGVPVEIRCVDVAGFAKNSGIGLEEAARELRYSIFAELTARGEIVATAHTAGDVVETMLFNLARGTGPRGLSGIPRTRDGIIRPLLEFWREELQAWLSAKSIGWMEDSSNLDLRFSRNRIRWLLLPELERVFGEGVFERLQRGAKVSAACLEFVQLSSRHLFDQALIAEFSGVLAFRSEPALESLWGFGEILRNCAEHYRIGLSGFVFEGVERLYSLVRKSPRGRRYPIFGGLILEADGEFMFIFSNPLVHSLQENLAGGQIVLESGLGTLELVGGDRELELRPANSSDKHPCGKGLLVFLAEARVPKILREIAPLVFYKAIPVFSPIVGYISKSEFEFIYSGPLEGFKQGKRCKNTKSIN